MTVLVTGGAGFIGSHVVDCLLAQGRRVVAIDNLRSGSVANVRHLHGREGFRLETGDLRDEAFLTRVVELGPFDTVYHLAALHYIPDCAARPAETLSVNVVGTQALLDRLNQCPPRRFLFASTGDVYAHKDGPHREEDPLEPFNIYGLSKLFGERLVEAASRSQDGASFVVARLFNTYGPRETNPHVIPQILGEIRWGDRIRLGNLWPERDYIYVSDTAAALLALGTYREFSPFQIFNVGTGVTASVEEVVKLLGQILGIRFCVEVDAERVRPVERPHLQADITRLQQATGWRPAYSLGEGLRRLCVAECLLKED